MLPYDTHSTKKLLPLTNLRKAKSFLRKTHLYILKKTQRFEKSFYFNHILRQICYSLMKKSDNQTPEQPTLARLARAQLANIG